MTSRSTDTERLLDLWPEVAPEPTARLFVEETVVRGAALRWRAGRARSVRGWRTTLGGVAVDRYESGYRHGWAHGYSVQALRKAVASVSESPGPPRVTSKVAEPLKGARWALDVAMDAWQSAAEPGSREAELSVLSRTRRLLGDGPDGRWTRTEREVHLVLAGGARVSHVRCGAGWPEAADIEATIARSLRAAAETPQAIPPAQTLRWMPRAAGRLVHELIGHPSEIDWPGSPAGFIDGVSTSGILVEDIPGPWAPDDEGCSAGSQHLDLSHRLTTSSTGPGGNARREHYACPVLPRMRELRVAPGAGEPPGPMCPRVVEVKHASVGPAGALFTALLERHAGDTAERVKIGIAPRVRILSVGNDAERHAARCLKAGQVVTVMHGAPSLWTEGAAVRPYE